MATSVKLTSVAPQTENGLQPQLVQQFVEACIQHLLQLYPSIIVPGAQTDKTANHIHGKSLAPEASLDTPPDSPKQLSIPTESAIAVTDGAITETAGIPDGPNAKTALKVLDILEKYKYSGNSQDTTWAAKSSLLLIVESYVSRNEPIQMVLPAFPFKSPNRIEKTLGALPDLGEELALQHLNGLCDKIQEVYQPGAILTIASDGLVYNDLLGVPDEEVYDYSSAVRSIIEEKGLKHIKAFRLVDLLPSHERQGVKLEREEYLLHAGCYRRELVARYLPIDFDSRAAVLNDKDTCTTYRGYVKFLGKDLANSPILEAGNPSKSWKKKECEGIAYQMIARGKAFAEAIKRKCQGWVRLSIHESLGETKLPLSLIPPPPGAPLMTPWHGSVVVDLDGSFRLTHAADVRDTHDLVLRNGRPYHWRERSELFDFGDMDVEFEHLYPCGLIIRVAPGKSYSYKDIDLTKVRKLVEMQSPVILRGFEETTDRDLFIKRAYELGTVLPWTFGILQEVKDHGRTDKAHNNVVSNEAMPMHFDGMFKYLPLKDANGEEVKDEQGNVVKVNAPPGFQYFTSIKTAPKGTGYTLFAAARLFWKYLPAPWNVERLEKVRWRMDNDGFWDGKYSNLPLVVRHPLNNKPCLRWHEPWPATKTKFSACDIKIENDDQQICDVVTELLYDRRICLRFEWEQGDILLSDNTAMLHTRTEFTGDCDRELWRIHFD